MNLTANKLVGQEVGFDSELGSEEWNEWSYGLKSGVLCFGSPLPLTNYHTGQMS